MTIQNLPVAWICVDITPKNTPDRYWHPYTSLQVQIDQFVKTGHIIKRSALPASTILWDINFFLLAFPCKLTDFKSWKTTDIYCSSSFQKVRRMGVYCYNLTSIQNHLNFIIFSNEFWYMIFFILVCSLSLMNFESWKTTDTFSQNSFRRLHTGCILLQLKFDSSANSVVLSNYCYIE